MESSNISKVNMKIFTFTFICITYLALGQNECLPASCGPSSPVVRFPFWLKGLQPEHCGYPEFGLSCNESGRADLDLQFPVRDSASNVMLPLKMTVAVWDIDYKAQKMLVGYARARSCLPEKVPTVTNSSASAFEVEAIGYGEGSTLFKCSNTRDYETIACLRSGHYKVINFASMYDITSLPPYSSCFKMYSISFVPGDAFIGTNDESGTRFYLGWSRPSCGECEDKGNYCRLQKNAGGAEETGCFLPQHGTTGASKNHKPLTAGITAGIIILALTVIASFFILKVIKRKKDERKRIEYAIKAHKDIKPRRYTYADVKRLSNNFKEKLSHGELPLHKGKLTDGTPVAVKVLDGNEQDIEDFLTEVEIIGQMQHSNIVQLIGYCVDGRRRALIYEFLQRSTLDMLLSSRNQNNTLSWEKVHQIGLGIAKGVECVHQESSRKIFNVVWNPRSILLDHNFNPTILVATTTCDDEGALQYIAPELFSSSSFNIIAQEAYAYGFGMLLLDMIGRNVSLSRGEESSEVNFPEWAFRQLEKREEGEIQTEEEDKGNESLVKKLLIVGLWCMQWFPCDRPSMKSVVEMLEQESVPAMPPNPFHHNTQ